MSTYKFKSSGKTSEIIKSETQTYERIPVGIKTPLRLDEKNLFSMHYNNADQIHDNLRNLLLTNYGERLGSYYYGTNLRDLTSELTTIEEFDEEAMRQITRAVERWMPYVFLKNFSSNFNTEENKNVALLKIMITYSVPQLEIEDRKLKISLHLI